MKIKTVYTLAIVVTAAILFVTSIPLLTSRTKDRIALSAKDTYVFKTYLHGGAIKIQLKDGLIHDVKNVNNLMTNGAA